MELAQIGEQLRQDAVSVVFLNVLLQQIGLPVPAVPTLLLAGSLALGNHALAGILAAAVLASVAADWLWYWAGKRFGYRVLSGLCKLSINPASCVSQTEARFVRWGLPSLVVAKFIPGFSTVAPPIAGTLRMNPIGFLAASAVGAALWAGLAILAGRLMREEVQAVMDILERNAAAALLVLITGIVVWLGWKFRQKARFRLNCAMTHISPEQLRAALDGPEPPLLLDLRGPAMIAESGPLAGARIAEHDFLEAAVDGWPKNAPIVTLCACPEDASAIQAARHLLGAGFLSVKPLKGGYEAWMALNRPAGIDHAGTATG
ncbi:MAG: VTT domain-containing protein [Azonexaceae bacterium]|nr:VTT domain-containing protein [Azonexaceae bacterium]